MAFALLLSGAVACAVARPTGVGTDAGAATAGAPRRGADGYRVALFPADNLSQDPVPVRAIDLRIARALSSAGLRVVSGDLVERFLERHRLRYTGGIDAAAAASAHEELGVDGVLIASVEQYDAEVSPRLAISMRLVAATDKANVVWMGGTARTGQESPGLLGLGVMRYPELEERELRRLAGSLVETLDGRAGIAAPCATQRRFRPRIAFRSRSFDPKRNYSIAVLPFVNETSRRRAGDVLALQFARQLAAHPRLRVVEPGVVRERLIGNRVVMEGGVSVDAARLVLDSLRADLVLAGYVRELTDGQYPAVNFTVLVLERDHGTIVWESTSHAKGSDGVWLFDLHKIATTSGLACHMASATVTAFVGGTG